MPRGLSGWLLTPFPQLSRKSPQRNALGLGERYVRDIACLLTRRVPDAFSHKIVGAHVRHLVQQAAQLYSEKRPHLAPDYLTPHQVHQ